MPSPLCHALLRNLDLFRPLADAQLNAALQDAAPCRLEAGAVAYAQGAPGAHFFVLLHGCLKVAQVTPEGEQIIVRYVNPGDMFGLACAMGQACYPATVLAVQESVCLAWPAAAWSTFTASHPQLAATALHTMGHRLQEAHQRIQELSNDDVEQRVARTILRLIDQSGLPTRDGVDIGFPITRQDIAEMTGTTLHTVSRLLSDWKQRGIIGGGGRMRIVLRSPAALARLCGHAPLPVDCAACLSCRAGPSAGVVPAVH
ncbi:Crp/Fnr family transcriptional regulator [Achromobacter marplatensis]|uniref:Crp/Fnr family transcriptional regulator n=1 Tax=Achromobacter marplatensis TaxID=470868 RepID=A0ABX9GA53_9BURK|nr:Crp/Fnr family transcriptional regulator [Achromobacter marplatensis]OWT62288.1 Crp/Fnr family transcriptional regulator [Achromobacter marplatensis]RBP16966.1 Crp/Fnr family transcriptional regulator [Achromobacter marplatensis]CAB3631494.1 Global nitrogen regulator [Achromobacter marplatensis]